MGPSPKPQVFQKQARKRFIHLYDEKQPNQVDSRVQPEWRVPCEAGRSCPVLWSACQPRHQGRRGGRAHPLTWGETKGSVCLGSVACSESRRHGLALGRHGGVAPTQGSGTASLSEECAFLTPPPQTAPQRPAARQLLHRVISVQPASCHLVTVRDLKLLNS